MKRWIDTNITGAGTEVDPRRPDLDGNEQNQDVKFSMLDRRDGTCLARVTAFSADMTTITGLAGVTVFNDTQAEQDIQNITSGSNLENLDVPDVETDDILNNHTIDDLLSQYEKNKIRILLLSRRELGLATVNTILIQRGMTSLEELVENAVPADLQNIIDDNGISPITQLSLNPAGAARASIQLPTRGGQVLQDQEFAGIAKAAKAEGLPSAGRLPENAKQNMPPDIVSMVEDILDGINSEHQDWIDELQGRGGPSPPPWAP